MVVSWWYLAFVLNGRREGNPEGTWERGVRRGRGGRRKEEKIKRGGEKNNLVLTFCS